VTWAWIFWILIRRVLVPPEEAYLVQRGEIGEDFLEVPV
jgi:hypothetical protein